MRLSKIFGKRSKEELKSIKEIDNKNNEYFEEVTELIIEKPRQKDSAVEIEESRIFDNPVSLYEETINYAREMHHLIQNKSFNTEIPPVIFIKKLLDEINKENQNLLLLTEKSTLNNYLYSHCANSCIMSLFLGKKLKLPEKDLIALGIAAFIYDIGLFDFFHIINKQGKLNSSEYSEVKKHVSRGIELAKEIKIPLPYKDEVLLAISQHHERIDGSGYPLGLKADEITQKAKILQVADVYESMTHFRVYRSPQMPHIVLKYFIEFSNKLFDLNLVKYIVELFSLYPLGSIIKLNTEEIGRVIKINHEFPTRPIVEIYVSGQKEVLNKPKIINLAKVPMLHIKEPIALSDVDDANKKLKFILNLKKVWI